MGTLTLVRDDTRGVLTDRQQAILDFITQSIEERGYPPYHPQMMVALLLYGYCVGVPSSRKPRADTSCANTASRPA